MYLSERGFFAAALALLSDSKSAVVMKVSISEQAPLWARNRTGSAYT
jgi:hypothetical protein